MKLNTGKSRRFSGESLLQIAMPMGGIGAGCICLNGSGGLQDFSLRHVPATTARPDGQSPQSTGFALLRVKDHEHSSKSLTKLLEGPLPIEKIYDQGLQTQGYRHGGHEGIPRFENATFEGQYPFGRVHLEDNRIPLQATIIGWNPFIPLDDVNSGLPCSLLEYTLTNTSSHQVDFEFSYHLSHLAAPSRGASEGERFGSSPIEVSELGGGILFDNNYEPVSQDFGTAALYLLGQQPKIKAAWFRGGWFDALSVLWKEVSSGQFEENTGDQFTGYGHRGGSIWLEASLAPGESVTYPVVIAWHFPNSNLSVGNDTSRCCHGWDHYTTEKQPAWRPFYAGKFRDAQDVAFYVAQNYDSLRSRTENFALALWSSTVPDEVLDAVASNLAILKSPTILRQEDGNVWAWEGCFTDAGCCHGSCTHVWNYAQSMPHLFPSLERTLREQELLYSMDERGHVSFRSTLPVSNAPHDFWAAADGQLGGILKLWRDYHICGDKHWLQTLFPAAQKSLDYCIATWDPERRGCLFEPHHNTYDIEFWGPDAMSGTIYIAALTAFADLANELGEEATSYSELAQRGAQFLDAELFNGEYYFQKVQWDGLRDTSFASAMAEVNTQTNGMTRLQKAEGPKYQYGTGCLSDGVIGAWMSELYGISTPLNRDHIRSTLKSIFRYNFKNDLFDHVCLQRPGYAAGHEPGLLLCTWPHGNKPTLPFVYSDEVWAGIEYQVACHLILQGMVEEGLTIVRAVRSRYDGHKRNPFNEYECGSYYARAMASYSLLLALSGFRYDAVSQTLFLAIKKSDSQEFHSFFSTASGFGTFHLKDETLTVDLIEGNLSLMALSISIGDKSWNWNGDIKVETGQSAHLSLNSM